MTAPPFAYYGGKTRLGARIADLLPAHRHYVEPFAGSLAVLLARAPSLMETVNDLDGDLMTFWRVLRDRPTELARVCQMTPHSRAEWHECEDLSVGDELERARRFWTRLSQGRAGRVFRTGWRHYVDPGATGLGFPGYLDAYVDRMAAAAARLHNVTLESRPAAELIERYGQCEGVLLYLDPPYLASTRSNRYDRSYRHEMMPDSAHAALAESVHRCRSSVVISGYPSELYDQDLYADWHRVTLRSGTGQGPNGGGNRTEVLWSNRPLGGADLFGAAS